MDDINEIGTPNNLEDSSETSTPSEEQPQEKQIPHITSKYGKYIGIAFCVWIVAIVAMLLITDNKIKDKDKQLRNDINNRVEEAFRGCKSGPYGTRGSFYDVAFSGQGVDYKKGKIPSRPQLLTEPNLKKISAQIQKEWDNAYGDLISFYETDWQNNHEGWELIGFTYDYDYKSDYETYIQIWARWFYPYAVGFRKQEYGFLYNYMPSVQEAIEEAYDFFTSDSQSNFIENFKPGSFNDILGYSNEYYFLKRDNIPRTNIVSLTGNNNEKESNYYTYMYNGYYRVFVAQSQISTWTVAHRWDGIDENERNTLWARSAIIISAIFIAIIIALFVMKYLSDKKKKETIQDRLYKVCNPKSYMKPYDKNKVDKANELYAELNNIDIEDSSQLIQFADKVATELGVSLVNKEQQNELKKIVNPAKFMKPYDEGKVKIANELYDILNKDSLKYSEYCYVIEKAKKLL